MKTGFWLGAALLVTSFAATDTNAVAQSTDVETLPLCRHASVGERCRRRNGDVVVRRDNRPGNFARPEIDDEVLVGVQADSANNIRVGDELPSGVTADRSTTIPRSEAGNSGDAPGPSNMESEFSDEDSCDDAPPPEERAHNEWTACPAGERSSDDSDSENTSGRDGNMIIEEGPQPN